MSVCDFKFQCYTYLYCPYNNTWLSILDAKLDAVQLLLHAFTSAGTFLNPQATRCSCLYSLEFDSAGCLSAASVRVCQNKFVFSLLYFLSLFPLDISFREDKSGHTSWRRTELQYSLPTTSWCCNRWDIEVKKWNLYNKSCDDTFMSQERTIT